MALINISEFRAQSKDGLNLTVQIINKPGSKRYELDIKSECGPVNYLDITQLYTNNFKVLLRLSLLKLAEDVCDTGRLQRYWE